MLSGFFGKVFSGFVAVVLAAGLLVYFYALQGIEAQVYRSVEQRVAQEAELVAEVVKHSWVPEASGFELESLESLASRLVESRITILDARGKVLFDSHEAVEKMDNHLARSEIQQVRQPVTRFSDTRGEKMIYQACPVEVQGRTEAYARVAVSTADRDARAAQLLRATRTGVLLASLVALLIAFGIARLVSRPLTEIVRHVGGLGRGEVKQRLELKGAQEFEQLAQAINTMSDEIEHQIDSTLADKAEREAILSAMGDGLVAVDSEQRVLFINQAARELLQVQQADPVGVPIWELHRSSSWNQVLAEMDLQGATDGKPKFAECTLFQGDSELHLDVSAAVFGSPDFERAGIVFVLRDVTELRRLEAVRRDFVSNVSHELKTPLTAMRGFLDVVLSDPKMSEEQRNGFINKALRNSEHLSSIVSDLLSLSRLESNEHRLRFEVLDLGELLPAVEEEAEDLAESRRIEVHYHPAQPTLLVHADEAALRMALLNLVGNAIRYSSEGSRVDVRVTRHEAEDGAQPPEAWIEVTDQGPGIPHSERERVFERFYRLDKVRTRGLGGTGLGLSIVRHVMATHGGRVELDSELGEGSTFRLILPEVQLD